MLSSFLGALPFCEYDNPMTAMYHIANGKSPPLGNIVVSEDAQSFVKACCAVDPESRLTVNDLLVHPFILTHGDADASCLSSDLGMITDSQRLLTKVIDSENSVAEVLDDAQVRSGSPPPPPPSEPEPPQSRPPKGSKNVVKKPMHLDVEGLEETSAPSVSTVQAPVIDDATPSLCSSETLYENVHK